LFYYFVLKEVVLSHFLSLVPSVYINQEANKGEKQPFFC